MKSSAPRLALATCLVASLAVKLVANRPVPPPDYGLFAARTAAALRDAGFATAVERRPLGPLVHGRRRGCRIMISDYTPYGTFADVLARRAAPIGPLRFSYRGTMTASAPKLEPLSEFYVARELRRIGIAVPRAPILAIAASPGCDPAAIDLRRLAELPR